MKLRDQLVQGLKELPGRRRFRLQVLISAPQKHGELFPYASVRPRVYAQHMLILCSEQFLDSNKDPNSEQDDAHSAGPPFILVTAIESTLFHIPTTDSAILYIAKVDSTGQGRRPAPTAALVRSLISYYASPTTRPLKLRGTTLWVHLFARAERQYLFPNSADHPAKKPLSDVKLCAWWKRVLGRVVQELDRMDASMYYVLPGMGEIEAMQAVGEMAGNNFIGPKWIYGHPYSQKEVALPYAPTGKTKDGFNLGQLIPSFDDDPKSRFMDEIACTTQVDGLRSPRRKRRKTEEPSARDAEEKREKESRIHGEMGVVSADEFWERMSFRQECVAGAITGFFFVIFPAENSEPSDPDTVLKEGLAANPLAPQPGEVSHHLVQRVVKSLMTGHEFSTTERSLKATSMLEASIKGLCSGPRVTGTETPKEMPPFLVGDDDEASVLDKDDNAIIPSRYLEPPKTPPRRKIALDGTAPAEGNDISPNPFPEPEPSADMYTSFMFGDVLVCNPDAPLAAPVGSVNGKNTNGSTGGVTVLTVRKKKRK